MAAFRGREQRSTATPTRLLVHRTAAPIRIGRSMWRPSRGGGPDARALALSLDVSGSGRAPCPMTAGVVSPPFGCLNAPLDERGIGSVLAYLNVRPVGVGPAGAGMSVVCYCGRLRGDDRALILCRRRLGLGILSPDAGTFAHVGPRSLRRCSYCKTIKRAMTRRAASAATMITQRQPTGSI